MSRFDYAQIHMGVRVNISLYAKTTEQAETAARAAYARFAELESKMSDYRPDSEVMQLCAKPQGEAVTISEDLFRVLARGQEVAQRSGGAFDVTCSPLVRLWRTARKSSTLPAQPELEKALMRVGFQNLQLDKHAKTAKLLLKGMQIDLGGIAKGDGCDQALAALRRYGVTRALVEAGGDMAAGEPPPGKSGWTISVDGLLERIELRNQALSTSGDTEQFVEIGGKRYSHILDPHTGLGLTTRLQVTVLARDGLTTDPLATAICVLGEAKGRRLAKRYGAQVWILRAR